MPVALTALMTDAYGGAGGIAEFNRHLLDALAADERLGVTALGLHGERTAHPVAALDWSIPANGKLGFAGAVARSALVTPPQLVLAGHLHLATLAHPLALASRARLWTTTHGIEVWRHHAGLGRGELAFGGRRLDDRLLARSSLVTAVSRYTRSRLLAWCPIAPERVELLPNTIDLGRFMPGPRPLELEGKLGVRGAKVLLTVSRLSPHDDYKGQDRVIPLLPELERRVGPVRYVIAGTGSDRVRLEDVARRANATRQVIFAGFVPEPQLPDYYRLADAFVMPSTGEGFGIVFLEALACGCPVVAGNRDGSVDALADGELGRLVDPFDPRAILEALVATLQGGRSHTEPVSGVERFGLERFRARVRDLVTTLLAMRMTERRSRWQSRPSSTNLPLR
ncbi:MAG: glycosyltransferase family 4 protein [Deltaproteobacteria bacterium]|nr:glycosyltransferase family 4 protein [Deltaproteobacteria bacterium]